MAITNNPVTTLFGPSAYITGTGAETLMTFKLSELGINGNYNVSGPPTAESVLLALVQKGSKSIGKIGSFRLEVIRKYNQSTANRKTATNTTQTRLIATTNGSKILHLQRKGITLSDVYNVPETNILHGPNPGNDQGWYEPLYPYLFSGEDPYGRVYVRGTGFSNQDYYYVTGTTSQGGGVADTLILNGYPTTNPPITHTPTFVKSIARNLQGVFSGGGSPHLFVDSVADLYVGMRVKLPNGNNFTITAIDPTFNKITLDREFYIYGTDSIVYFLPPPDPTTAGLAIGMAVTSANLPPDVFIHRILNLYSIQLTEGSGVTSGTNILTTFTYVPLTPHAQENYSINFYIPSSANPADYITSVTWDVPTPPATTTTIFLDPEDTTNVSQLVGMYASASSFPGGTKVISVNNTSSPKTITLNSLATSASDSIANPSINFYHSDPTTLDPDNMNFSS